MLRVIVVKNHRPKHLPYKIIFLDVDITPARFECKGTTTRIGILQCFFIGQQTTIITMVQVRLLETLPEEGQVLDISKHLQRVR